MSASMLVCFACSRMSSSFGYLNKIGYNGFIFPIVIGESGSRYTDVRCLHNPLALSTD